MDIRVLPIRVNKNGNFSLLVKETDDSKQFGFFNFSHPETPDAQTVLTNLPKELRAESGATVRVNQVPCADESAAYFVVAGNENALSALPPSPESRWVEQTQLKFGPLPDGVEAAKELKDELYTGSLASEDLFTAVAGVHALRAMRAGVDPEESALSSDIGFLRLIAEDQTLVAQIMDKKRDVSFPPLADDGTGSKPAAWRSYKSIFTNIASLAASRAADKLTENRPQVEAKRAEAAMETRAAGNDPKPA